MSIIHATSENFKEIISRENAIVLVDFFAEWCGPCKALSPILEEVSLSLNDNQLIVKVDIDKCKDIAKSYVVMSVPTLIVFKDGAEATRLVGLRSKEEIEVLLK